MDYISIKETTIELRSIGPKVDASKRPTRIIKEYKIGSPTEDIRKTEEDKDANKQNMSG
jgi:hypothetical protein